MGGFAASGATVIEKLQQGYHEQIGGLSAEALNWSPGPEMNSIAVLATHAWGSTRFWLWAAAGKTVERDRDAEFRARAGSAAELTAFVDRCAADAAEALRALDGADLGASRDIRGSTVTVGYGAIHAFEHCGEHLGHVGLTRQLWQQQAK